MPLPKLAVPEYECTLPVSGTKVSYRPFLVKEEKLLYIAMESQDEKEMIKAVKNILKACTNVKKVDDLATFEIEYLFLRIRSKAVGGISEFKVVCEDDGVTSASVKIDLEDIVFLELRFMNCVSSFCKDSSMDARVQCFNPSF